MTDYQKTMGEIVENGIAQGHIIGANVLPLFRLVSGGRGRTLFVFRCVYDGCSAFLEARRFWGLTD